VYDAKKRQQRILLNGELIVVGENRNPLHGSSQMTLNGYGDSMHNTFPGYLSEVHPFPSFLSWFLTFLSFVRSSSVSGRGLARDHKSRT
jgi:hypothetical protein